MQILKFDMKKMAEKTAKMMAAFQEAEAKKKKNEVE